MTQITQTEVETEKVYSNGKRNYAPIMNGTKIVITPEQNKKTNENIYSKHTSPIRLQQAKQLPILTPSTTSLNTHNIDENELINNNNYKHSNNNNNNNYNINIINNINNDNKYNNNNNINNDNNINNNNNNNNKYNNDFIDSTSKSNSSNSKDDKHMDRPRSYSLSKSENETSLTDESLVNEKQMQELVKNKEYRLSVVEIDHTHEMFSVTVDRYGFPTEQKTDEKAHRLRVRKENERLEKWRRMLFSKMDGKMQNLSSTDVVHAQIHAWNKVKKHKKLKSRVRKGVPQALRGTVWQNLCGARERRASECKSYGSNRLYRDLVEKDKSPHHLQLWKDINRTYRKQVRFGAVGLSKKLNNNNKNNINNESKSQNDKLNIKKHSKKVVKLGNKDEIQIASTPQDLEKNATDAQRQLYNVLKAFSLYREDIGYCQGMQSITALMLMHVTEEESFWILASLADDIRYQMEWLWRPKMPGIQLRFYQMERLVEICLPKLHKHFEKNDITSCSMYQASQWFITVFLSTKMRFDCILRVWDIYLNEGLKTIFRMGLGFLKYYEKQLLESSMEEMMKIFSFGAGDLNTDQYIETCLKIRITHAQLQSLEKQFAKLQSKQNRR